MMGSDSSRPPCIGNALHQFRVSRTEFFDTKVQHIYIDVCSRKDALPSVGHSALMRLSIIVRNGMVIAELCQNNGEHMLQQCSFSMNTLLHRRVRAWPPSDKITMETTQCNTTHSKLLHHRPVSMGNIKPQ